MAETFKDGDILYAKPLNDLANQASESASKVDGALVKVEATDARTAGFRTTLEIPERIQFLDAEGKLIAEFDETGKKIFYGGVKAEVAEFDKLKNSDGTNIVAETSAEYLGTEVDDKGKLLWGTSSSTGQKVYLSKLLRNDAGLWRGTASIMGDSITANGYKDGAFEGRSWHLWASMALQGQFFVEGVFATGGYTSSQIRNEWLPKAILKKSEFCIVMAGRNDVNLGYDIENTTIPNMTYIYNQLMLNGIWPVCCTMSAHGNSEFPEKRKAEHKVNNWIRAFARKHGLPLVDLHKITVDPKTGDWLPGIAADVSHPTYIGARIMSQALRETMEKWCSPSLPTMAEEQLDLGFTNNVIPNPLFYTTNEDKTVPEGWTKSGDGVSEVVVDATGKGDVLHLSGACRFTIPVNVVAGKKYGFGIKLKTLGDAVENRKSVYVKPTPDDSGTKFLAGINSFSGEIADWSYLYNEFTAPDDVTTVTIAIALASGEAWFRQVGLFELSEVKQ